METSNLRGSTVLVTGAGSGIGRELALLAARRGADLVICDVDEPGLAEVETAVRDLGGRVLARRVDVASRDQMRDFAEAVQAEAGPVDLLVNNAGVGLGAGFLDTELEDWDWVLAVNVLGVVHGCHFFVPTMVERGAGGHVVNL
jgi:NAD(P)-dependent dehydrogenase (short-subunit alcohol dehydrogenase family)